MMLKLCRVFFKIKLVTVAKTSVIIDIRFSVPGIGELNTLCLVYSFKQSNLCSDPYKLFTAAEFKTKVKKGNFHRCHFDAGDFSAACTERSRLSRSSIVFKI